MYGAALAGGAVVEELGEAEPNRRFPSDVERAAVTGHIAVSESQVPDLQPVYVDTGQHPSR
jgi:hypothetical protein